MSRKIRLINSELSTTVDDGDFEWLSKFKWFAWWNPETKSIHAARHIILANGQPSVELMEDLILGLPPRERLPFQSVNPGQN